MEVGSNELIHLPVITLVLVNLIPRGRFSAKLKKAYGLGPRTGTSFTSSTWGGWGLKETVPS